jgi:folate-dependent phosphoribosylglycinamide formyltransferase PurN
MRIAVTSGYARSLHAIALVTLLHRAGHEVGVCLTVRMFNLRRFRAYFRQYGPRLFRIVRERALPQRSAGQRDPEIRYIDECLRRRDVAHRTLRGACKEAHARLVRVSSLNAPEALAALDGFRVELIVYAGGGILRKPLLDRATIGVLNAHGGPLPVIRGMSAGEWALFKGLRPDTAVHFVDAGIDTGPVLFHVPQPVDSADTVPDVRGKAVVVGVEALIEAVSRIAGGRYKPCPQVIEAGVQHFAMHPLLVSIVEDWIGRGLTPVAATPVLEDV